LWLVKKTYNLQKLLLNSSAFSDDFEKLQKQRKLEMKK